MKTAMQDVIDDLKENNPDHYQNNKRWYDNLLEKEKQQIIDAIECPNFWEKYTSAKDYYNETFKKQ